MRLRLTAAVCLFLAMIPEAISVEGLGSQRRWCAGRDTASSALDCGAGGEARRAVRARTPAANPAASADSRLGKTPGACHRARQRRRQSCSGPERAGRSTARRAEHPPHPHALYDVRDVDPGAAHAARPHASRGQGLPASRARCPRLRFPVARRSPPNVDMVPLGFFPEAKIQARWDAPDPMCGLR
jgi:hypothetical protein